MTTELLLATRNAGKVREIRELTPPHIPWRSLSDFPDVPEAPEEGCTFAENARSKALFYAARTGLPALADDSGLEVAALNGAPGVYSAIYAGEPRDDVANNRKLIAALRDVGYGKSSSGVVSASSPSFAQAIPVPDAAPAQAAARFCCAMALAAAGKIVLESSGTVSGVIVDTLRGANGFGYDPHFLIPQLGRTLAELHPDEKNAISHRGHALRQMLAAMSAYFGWG